VIPPTTKIMRVSVTLGELTLDTARQPDLFANDDKERQRCEALSRTMDGLNSRFGQTVVSVGPGRRLPVAMSGRRSATRAFQKRRTTGELARCHPVARPRCRRAARTHLSHLRQGALRDPAQLLALGDFGHLWLSEVQARARCKQRGCKGAMRLALPHRGETKGFVGGIA
jgi:hypothetical protein